MRSVRRTWLTRLVATVATLALVVACTAGTYSHAAGHHHGPHPAHSHDHGPDAAPSHHYGPLDGPRAAHSGTVDEQAAVELGHAHAPPGSGKAHTDCFDPICHGGYAMLDAAAVIARPLGSEHFIPPATSLTDAQPGRLERPPKPSVHA